MMQWTAKIHLSGLANPKIFYVLLATAIAILSGCNVLRSQEESFHSPVQPTNVRQVRMPSGAQKQLEPSGLLFFENQWLIVSDEKDVADIYRLKELDDQTLQAEPFILASTIPGFAVDDLEGITFCRGRFLVVEEGSSLVVEVEKNGKAIARPLDLIPIHKERNFA